MVPKRQGGESRISDFAFILTEKSGGNARSRNLATFPNGNL